MRIILITIMTMSLASQAMAAGPFGLSMGMMPADIKGAKPTSTSGIYTASRTPRRHALFKSFHLMYGQESGLCKIVALSKPIDTNVYGSTVKTTFGEMVAELRKKYGKNKLYDSSAARRASGAHNRWMSGLLDGEEKLDAFWDKKKGSTLDNNLQAITLNARARTADSGFLILTYEFSNIGRCIEEIKNPQKSKRAAKPKRTEESSDTGKGRQVEDDRGGIEAERDRIAAEREHIKAQRKRLEKRKRIEEERKRVKEQERIEAERKRLKEEKRIESERRLLEELRSSGKGSQPKHEQETVETERKRIQAERDRIAAKRERIKAQRKRLEEQKRIEAERKRLEELKRIDAKRQQLKAERNQLEEERRQLEAELKEFEEEHQQSGE